LNRETFFSNRLKIRFAPPMQGTHPGIIGGNMDLGSLSSVAAYSTAMATSEAKEEANLKTVKQGVDMQADLAMQLVQSISPTQAADPVGNPGQNVSVVV
jgi:hypothetical protein